MRRRREKGEEGVKGGSGNKIKLSLSQNSFCSSALRGGGGGRGKGKGGEEKSLHYRCYVFFAACAFANKYIRNKKEAKEQKKKKSDENTSHAVRKMTSCLTRKADVLCTFPSLSLSLSGRVARWAISTIGTINVHLWALLASDGSC